MNGEVIKSFLVGLGFGVDETSLAKFNNAIKSASTRVLALYGSVKVAAAGIFYGISKISEGFEQLGYEYRIIAPMLNKTLVMRRELLKAYGAAGINITKVVQESVKFNMSLAKTKFALEAIYKSVGAKFFPLLTKQMDVFRSRLYANMPKIQSALERFVKFIFKAFEATTILGGRLFSILGRIWDMFVDLDKATGGWSTKILAAVAAWQLLNLSFLSTPLGMIITGLVALLALWDDFQTFKEGGESLIDWKKLEPLVNQVTKVFQNMFGFIKDAINGVYLLINAFYKLFHMDYKGFLQGITDWFQNALGMVGRFGDHIKSVFGLFGAFSDTLKNFNPVSLPGAANGPPATPIGNMAPPMQSSQNVSQQTSIVVQGSPDAQATGRAVAGEQNRVNFDMVRNMKGATR